MSDDSADDSLPPDRPDDPATAACGDAQRCYSLGSEAERKGDAVRAAELFGVACDLELGQACFRVGEMLRDGRGVGADEGAAIELFSRGCRYGDPSACDALGH